MKRSIVNFEVRMPKKRAHHLARVLLEADHTFSVNLGIGTTKIFIFWDKTLITNGVTETIETPGEVRNRWDQLILAAAGKRCHFEVYSSCDGQKVLPVSYL